MESRSQTHSLVPSQLITRSLVTAVNNGIDILWTGENMPPELDQNPSILSSCVIISSDVLHAYLSPLRFMTISLLDQVFYRQDRQNIVGQIKNYDLTAP